MQFERVEVSLGEAKKKRIRDSFFVYPIQIKCPNCKFKKKIVNTSEKEVVSFRRYSEFCLLRSNLQVLYPCRFIHCLPEKKITMSNYKIHLFSENEDFEFGEKRRFGLEKFLQYIFSHPQLKNDITVAKFIFEDNDSWKETLVQENNNSENISYVFQVVKDSVMKFNFSNLNNTNSSNNNLYCVQNYQFKNNEMSEFHENQKTFSNSDAIINLLEEISDKKNESKVEDSDWLKIEEEKFRGSSTLVKTIVKIKKKYFLCERNLFRLNSGLGEVLSFLSVSEDDETLQAAGHYVDAYSENIVPLVDEGEFWLEFLFLHSSNLFVMGDLMKKTFGMTCAKTKENLKQFQDIISCESSRDFNNNDNKTEDNNSSASNNHSLSKKENLFDTDKIQIVKEEVERFKRESDLDLARWCLNFSKMQSEKFRKSFKYWSNIQGCLKQPS